MRGNYIVKYPLCMNGGSPNRGLDSANLLRDEMDNVGVEFCGKVFEFFEASKAFG